MCAFPDPKIRFDNVQCVKHVLPNKRMFVCYSLIVYCYSCVVDLHSEKPPNNIKLTGQDEDEKADANHMIKHC